VFSRPEDLTNTEDCDVLKYFTKRTRCHTPPRAHSRADHVWHVANFWQGSFTENFEHRPSPFGWHALPPLSFYCSMLGVVLNQFLFVKGLSLTTVINASLLGTTIPAFTLIVIRSTHCSSVETILSHAARVTSLFGKHSTISAASSVSCSISRETRRVMDSSSDLTTSQALFN
jgi:hypothetical protein